MTPEQQMMNNALKATEEALAKDKFVPLVEIYEDDDAYRCEVCRHWHGQPAVRYGDHAVCKDCSHDGDALERISRTLEGELNEACAALAAERN